MRLIIRFRSVFFKADLPLSYHLTTAQCSVCRPVLMKIFERSRRRELCAAISCSLRTDRTAHQQNQPSQSCQSVSQSVSQPASILTVFTQQFFTTKILIEGKIKKMIHWLKCEIKTIKVLPILWHDIQTIQTILFDKIFENIYLSKFPSNYDVEQTLVVQNLFAVCWLKLSAVWSGMLSDLVSPLRQRTPTNNLDY